MTVLRQFVNYIVGDPARSAAFYQRVFGLEVRFESDWFMHLAAPGQDSLELGFLLEGHELVASITPACPAGGQVLTLVVDQLDPVLARVREHGGEVVEPPQDLFYGQRRALVRDVDGTVVDVSVECSPDPEWMARVRRGEDGRFVEESSG